MTFSINNPIYIQIADALADDILTGKLTPLNRVPSIRDLSAQFMVNANTITRALDLLQSQNVVFNQRGIGFFVAEDAPANILTTRREKFISTDLKYIFRQMQLLNISPDQFINMYNQFTESQNEKIK